MNQHEANRLPKPAMTTEEAIRALQDIRRLLCNEGSLPYPEGPWLEALDYAIGTLGMEE